MRSSIVMLIISKCSCSGMSARLQLTVRDYGPGFEVDKAMYGRGLGLISMRERVSAVKGTIVIRSKPQRGHGSCCLCADFCQ